jgi:NADP-dependent 3-hydroxy acid dehydrogenase YdfG
MTTARDVLDGQTAIVTGASSGIGLAITRLLFDAGCSVAVVGRDLARLQPAIEGIADERRLAIACDVRDDDAVQRMVAGVEQAWGRVDILVNSAGLFSTAPLTETSNEMWNDLWQTNVNGTFYPTRAALPGMIERGSGTIVIMSSVAAHRGYPGNTAYSASKYAVTGFARALTTEVRRKGVRVVNVMPGPVATPIWDGKDLPMEREQMLTAQEVAQATINAMTVSSTQVIEDVLLLPQDGLYF